MRVSEVVGKPAAGPSGHPVGRIADLVVRLLDRGRPTVTGGLLRVGSSDVFVSLQNVQSMDQKGITLDSDRVDLRPFERRRGEVLLDRDVRGRAVIDVEGARLVRVGDLVLEGTGSSWQVSAVAATVPATFSSVMNRVFRRSGVDEEVDWQRVEPLTGHVPTAGAALKVPRLARLKPAEIADIVEAATHEEGEEILEAVGADEELEADVFEELDEGHQVEFVKDRSDQETAELLSNMDPDHAADLLIQLPQDRRLPLLHLLDADQQRKIRHLLGFHPDSAGGLMNNEFVVMASGDTVAVAIGRLRALEEVPAVFTDLLVTEGGKLVGSISLSGLLRADPKEKLAAVMQRDPEAVYTDADLPSVAVQMSDYNLATLPVVDREGELVGVITYDDLIEAMLPEEWRWRGKPEAARLNSDPLEAPQAQ